MVRTEQSGVIDLFAILEPDPICFQGMTANQLRMEIIRLKAQYNNPTEAKWNREVARTRCRYCEDYLKTGRYQKESNA